MSENEDKSAGALEGAVQPETAGTGFALAATLDLSVADKQELTDR